jgi:hypothetical protein
MGAHVLPHSTTCSSCRTALRGLSPAGVSTVNSRVAELAERVAEVTQKVLPDRRSWKIVSATHHAEGFMPSIRLGQEASSVSHTDTVPRWLRACHVRPAPCRSATHTIRSSRDILPCAGTSTAATAASGFTPNACVVIVSLWRYDDAACSALAACCYAAACAIGVHARRVAAADDTGAFF